MSAQTANPAATPDDQLSQEYVSVRLAGQLLGIPVLMVQDVLKAQTITRIPLAPPWIAGVLNLRGRIVTAIDLRHRLGFEARGDDETDMSVVVNYNDEPYSLQIDSVGDVLDLTGMTVEKTPVTLDSRWREVASGIVRLDEELLVLLDVEKLLSLDGAEKAA